MTARAYLRSRSWLGKKFGLSPMRALVRALDHPERAFKSVLIAGTNGKGSVSACLDTALRACPLKVGRYTSPHLTDIRERITVSGRNIGRADFERLVLHVRDQADRLIRAGKLEAHPNHFEILTAVAFLFFREQAIDLAVLEVGLGGRLDATNVASPLVSAIVSLDFDHEDLLGNTLAAIAREKAGVLRRNRVTVLGPMPQEAKHAITESAKVVGARLVPAFEGTSLRTGASGLTVATPAGRYPGLTTLPGAHQRANLAVAIRMVEALAAAGIPVDPAHAVHAMNDVRWPGRLERVEGSPPFLLDAAHNPAGARALAAYLKSGGVSHLLVFGAMRDKHIQEMADALFPPARLVIGTRPRMTRAATTGELKGFGSALGKVLIEEPSIARALARARKEALPGEVVVVAGSLYLVAAVRKRLIRG